jgi:hypothetical protein
MVPTAAVRTTPSSVAQYALLPVVALIGVPVVKNVFAGTAPMPAAANL